MKKLNSRQTSITVTPLALFLLLLILSPLPALAQSDSAGASNQIEQAANTPGVQGGDPLRRLNLTPDQIERIRAINEQNRAQWRAARQQLNQAQRALEEAIYSDTADEAVIEESARAVATAQGEVVRLRALTELNIRRVLTPDQLSTLRNLRRQARSALRDRRFGSQGGPAAPLRDRLMKRPGMSIQRDGNRRPVFSPRERRGELLRSQRP